MAHLNACNLRNTIDFVRRMDIIPLLMITAHKECYPKQKWNWTRTDLPFFMQPGSDYPVHLFWFPKRRIFVIIGTRIARISSSVLCKMTCNTRWNSRSKRYCHTNGYYYSQTFAVGLTFFIAKRRIQRAAFCIRTTVVHCKFASFETIAVPCTLNLDSSILFYHCVLCITVFPQITKTKNLNIHKRLKHTVASLT